MKRLISHRHFKRGIALDRKRILKPARIYFISLISISFGLAFGLYAFMAKQDLRLLMSKEQFKVKNSHELILAEMESILGDLLQIANDNELKRYLESNEAGALAALQQQLLFFCKSKKRYDQARYLDETGMEIVRINDCRGNPNIVPENQLQEKSGRYYFKETLKMPKGMIYVSPFDLNIENGKIEVPIKPVIRFCAPVADTRGHGKGMVVLSFRGEFLFNKLSSMLSTACYSYWLLNKQGFWLYSGQPELNWGFMYPGRKEQKFGEKFPDEWRMILKKAEGQFQTKHGIFTFKKIFPLTDTVHHFGNGRGHDGHGNDLFDATQYHWIMVSRISPADLGRLNAGLKWFSMALATLLAVVSAVISWFYARNKIVDALSIQMVEDVARLNESLMASSSVISERTDLSKTLKRALGSAMRLSHARYGALMIVKDRVVQDIIIQGPAENEKTAIKGRMHNSGLLKTIMAEKKAVRLSEVSNHPEFRGFPPGHPGIKTLLAVPLIHQDEVLGTLLLSEKTDDRSFSGQDEKIVVTFADHIAAATQRAALYEEIKLGASIFNNSIEGICITDVGGNIVKVNNAFSTITGYGPEEVVGRNPRILKSDRHGRRFYKKMWAALLETGKWEGEIWNRRKNGDTYPEWLSISAVKNHFEQTEHYVAVFHDISEVIQTQEKLQHQAHHDALTGLPNRQLFNDRLQRALARSKRHGKKLALLFLDLDNFKLVNDSIGHMTGDLLLQGVASRLLQNCREEDTVARLGGDEFIIIMSDLENPWHDAVMLAQRIIAALGQPFQLSENEVITATSIGITIFPEDGDSAAELVKNADMAMYKAKKEGKSRYALFTDEMNQNMVRRVSLESDLRQALQRNEFVLFYQPKINIETGLLSGAEALIRWKRDQQELIPPDEFIPLAEETGLISEIGAWAILQACKQAKAWHNRGNQNLTVAVNLSPKQLRDGAIRQTVEHALSVTGLPPQSLTLEITENVMVFDVENTIAIMQGISDLGVRWAMDDFGTGYSSIRYLQRLPLNKLKIDKSFLEGIPGNTGNEKIVNSTVALARSFNLDVVAEGVERIEQFRFLFACRCNEAQGYFFSRPLPPVAFEDFLDQHGKTNWNAQLSDAGYQMTG